LKLRGSLARSNHQLVETEGWLDSKRYGGEIAGLLCKSPIEQELNFHVKDYFCESPGERGGLDGKRVGEERTSSGPGPQPALNTAEIRRSGSRLGVLLKTSQRGRRRERREETIKMRIAGPWGSTTFSRVRGNGFQEKGGNPTDFAPKKTFSGKLPLLGVPLGESGVSSGKASPPIEHDLKGLEEK